jgi:phage shock protein E
MKGIFVLAVVALLVFVFKLRAAGTLPLESAREHLKQGALLMDVRTVAEYNAKRLTNAINIPLDQVQQELPRRMTDRSKVVLLHCRSGRRSGIAEKELRALGYTNVFNIGSFGQAEEVVNGAR